MDTTLDQDIAARFLHVTNEYPGAIAIVQSGYEPVTYGELETRSAALALRLTKAGVTSGRYVAVCATRSIDAIVAIVAILRAGGAYVPVEPTYPDAKLAEMLGDTQPAVILSAPCALPRLERLKCEGEIDPSVKLWDIGQAACASDGASIPLTAARASLDDPAYVMFTSGSTGKPKGVIVPQRAILRLVIGQDFCELPADEVILHLAPLNFDASTLEIWGALLNGGVLAIMPDTRPSTAEIANALRDHHVTTVWLTAGLFHLMVDEELESLTGLRQLLAGGDVLSPDHVRRFLAAAPHSRMINGYGPTENTTFTCCATLTAGEWPCPSAPIGRAISGTEAFIVDEALHPVVDGEIGQLVAAGDGLALGYLGNPELTAERFVEAPAPIGKRVYLTGDLARVLPDGQIEFLGRMDRQVKIDGKRVEPGEIEDVLRRCAGVQDAAIAVSRSETGVHRLIGFVIADVDSLEGIEVEARKHLPEHMWPTRLLAIDSLPITLNGKIDRDALLAIEAGSTRKVAGATNAAEEAVTELWRAALGIENIGIDEAFFDLGGRSLQLMRVHKGLEQAFGRKIAVPDLFARPTIRAMARLAIAPVQSPEGTDSPLNAAQARAQMRRTAMARRGRPAIREAAE